MKIDFKNNCNFAARYNEQDIVRITENILKEKNPIPQKELAYFKDMLKGSAINPFRKAEIDEWIRINDMLYSEYDSITEEKVLKSQILYEAYAAKSKLERQVDKIVINPIKKLFGSRNNNIDKHHKILELREVSKYAEFYKQFKDLFDSYLELKPLVSNEGKDIDLDRKYEDFIQSLVGGTKNSTKVPSEKLENIDKTMTNVQDKKKLGPRSIRNVTEAEAREQLSKYRELKQWCNENIDWHNFKVGEGAHKVFLEEYRPLEKQVKANNISIIERKIFSINPLEDIEAKHQYIHYEVIPNAGFNESSFLDALDMFELYGKRESYQGIGISTISEMLSSLPTDPSSETVERMIKICGKHVTPLRYPDERDGAPNSLTYVQNYLVAFSKPGVLHTEEQVKLFLDNGRTMFWNDGHIDELANVLMVDKNALFKGNEKVRSMLDEMFECAAKNREPYLSERSMQVHLKFWKNLDKHYKRS